MTKTFKETWDMPLIGIPRPSRIRLLKELSMDALLAMTELPEEPTQVHKPLRRHARVDSITELTSVLQLSGSVTLGEFVGLAIGLPASVHKRGGFYTKKRIKPS